MDVAEADARQLYRDQACDSMYACCVRVLLMSEDAACRRIDAARVARRFPRIFPALEDGRLNVSAILLLKPHLTTSNADELISAAEGKSYRAIKEFLACRFPQANLPTVLRRIGVSEAEVAPVTKPQTLDESSTAMAVAPIAESASQSRASDSAAVTPSENTSQSLSAAPRIHVTSTQHPGPTTTPIAPLTEQRPRIAPLSAERYSLQVTISKHAHDLLRGGDAGGELSDLLGRVIELDLERLDDSLRVERRTETLAQRSAVLLARYVVAVDDGDARRGQAEFVRQRVDAQGGAPRVGGAEVADDAHAVPQAAREHRAQQFVEQRLVAGRRVLPACQLGQRQRALGECLEDQHGRLA